jgi:cell division protein FtsB
MLRTMTEKEINETKEIDQKARDYGFVYYIPQEFFSETLAQYHDYMHEQRRNKKIKPHIVELEINGEIKQFRYEDLGAAVVYSLEFICAQAVESLEALQKERDALQERCNLLEKQAVLV